MMVQRLPFILIGVFALLLGLAQLLILPPFEGIDEFGHYSVIRQFARQGLVFDSQKMFIDQAFFEYQKKAPTFYSVHPPYDENGGMTYRSFHERAELAPEYRLSYRDSPFVTGYKESATYNWQQQHPPLYYLALAVVQRVVGGLDFVGQFFSLRLCSFAMALAGFMIGLWGSLRYSDPKFHRQILTGFALYPVLFLQFTPEFARLGNDSLCLLIMGCVWACFLRMRGHIPDWRASLGFGALLGAGLLTKAFFIPIAIGYFAYRLLQMFAARHDRQACARLFDHLLYVGLPLVVFGFWYIAKSAVTGTFLGHHEYQLAAQGAGSLWQRIAQNNTAEDLMFTFLTIPATALWSGTFSQARFDELFFLPYFFFGLWIWARGVRVLGRLPLNNPAWLGFWMAAFFIAGILHHAVTVLSLAKAESTPGWYFHILAPAMAYWLSFAIERIRSFPLGRFLLKGMIAYSMIFLVATFWQQLALYSGCATLGPRKIVESRDGALCLTHTDLVFHRADSLAWVYWGSGAFFLALLMFVALIIALRPKRFPAL